MTFKRVKFDNMVSESRRMAIYNVRGKLVLLVDATLPSAMRGRVCQYNFTGRQYHIEEFERGEKGFRPSGKVIRLCYDDLRNLGVIEPDEAILSA